MATRNLQNNCPACKAFHVGQVNGDEERFSFNVGENVEYVFFRFLCSGCNRLITLFEAPFLQQRVFWASDSEDILDKYSDVVKTRKLFAQSTCLYLYHPAHTLIDWDDLKQRVDKLRKPKMAFSAVHEERLVLPDWLAPLLVRTWKVPATMIAPVFGTKYPAPVLELNVRSMARRWAEFKLLSVYTTCLSGFDCPNGQQDWETITNLAGKG